MRRCTIHDGSDARRIVKSLNISLISQLLEIPFLGWISTYKDDMKNLKPVVDKSRLTQLEKYGLIEPISVPERGGRWAYALTEKGRTVVVTLREGGARRSDKNALLSVETVEA